MTTEMAELEEAWYCAKVWQKKYNESSRVARIYRKILEGLNVNEMTLDAVEAEARKYVGEL